MATGGVQHFQDARISGLIGDFNEMSNALGKHHENQPAIVVLVVTFLRHLFCTMTSFLDHLAINHLEYDVEHSEDDIVRFVESLDKRLRQEVAGEAESGFREFWLNLISHFSNSYTEIDSQNYVRKEEAPHKPTCSTQELVLGKGNTLNDNNQRGQFRLGKGKFDRGNKTDKIKSADQTPFANIPMSRRQNNVSSRSKHGNDRKSHAKKLSTGLTLQDKSAKIGGAPPMKSKEDDISLLRGSTQKMTISSRSGKHDDKSQTTPEAFLPPVHTGPNINIINIEQNTYPAKSNAGFHPGSMSVDESRRAPRGVPNIQQEPVEITVDCRDDDLSPNYSPQPPDRQTSDEKDMSSLKIVMKYVSSCITRSLDGNVILIGKGTKIIICDCDGEPNPDMEPIECGGLVFDAAWIRDDCIVAVVRVDSKFEVITLTDLTSDEPTRVTLDLCGGAVPQGITHDEHWLYVCDVGTKRCLHRFGIEDLNLKDETPLEHDIRPHKVGSNDGHIIVTDLLNERVLVIKKGKQVLGPQTSYDIRDIIRTDAASGYAPTGVYCCGNTIFTLKKPDDESKYLATDIKTMDMEVRFLQVLTCKDPTGVIVTNCDVSIVSTSDNEPMGATPGEPQDHAPSEEDSDRPSGNLWVPG